MFDLLMKDIQNLCSGRLLFTRLRIRMHKKSPAISGGTCLMILNSDWAVLS